MAPQGSDAGDGHGGRTGQGAAGTAAPFAGLFEAEQSPLDAAVAQRDADILGMVRRALDRRDVLLAFQPVVDARATGRVAFHEGLLRVMDDTGRIIPAREFIAACERTETGRVLDCVALEAGLAALADTPSLRLSINMSARSIGYARWMRVFEAGIARDPTVAERLIIEITESSAILLPEITLAFMSDLQAKGVSFALDDFGAGYTSFRYLRDLDFDILKIAGEYCNSIAASPDNRVLCEALVGLAAHFDMFTVAEGVERMEDAEILTAIGLDCLQGHAFGTPVLHPSFGRAAARRMG
jgi:EAL domain-containing protein (putative c-di-GMP-specific phosphodiesterase class I)